MSEENLCVKCEKRPVLVKKRNLCRLCYQRERKKNGPFINPTSHNYAHPQYRENQKISREMAFVKNFFNHSDWIYSPATFKFNGLKYTPDFYDSHRNTFIEVAGSRQAYITKTKTNTHLSENIFQSSILKFDNRMVLY